MSLTLQQIRATKEVIEHDFTRAAFARWMVDHYGKTGKLRAKQRRPLGDWRVWLLLAGRGFGKTLTLSSDAIAYAKMNPGHRIGFVGATQSDVRKVLFEGDSGLINVCPPELLAGGNIDDGYNKSLLEITFDNGSIIQGFSAERPDRLRGPQFHRVYADELAAWQRLRETWDQIQLVNRLGTDPRIVVATTPKPVPLLQELVNRVGQDVVMTQGSTRENEANLAPSFIRDIYDAFAGTDQGSQELEGKLIMELPDAMFRRDWIQRTDSDAEFDKVVIAVDPSISKKGDAVGIVAMGRKNGQYYVLADESGKYGPTEWPEVVLRLADRDYIHADRIVAEVNQGGEMVETLLKIAAQDMFKNEERDSPDIDFQAVHAHRNKVSRAGPVANLYQQGKVHHVGIFDELEAEMTSFTRSWDRAKDPSPNRLDALVYAAWYLGRKKKRRSAIISA